MRPITFSVTAKKEFSGWPTQSLLCPRWKQRRNADDRGGWKPFETQARPGTPVRYAIQPSRGNETLSVISSFKRVDAIQPKCKFYSRAHVELA